VPNYQRLSEEQRQSAHAFVGEDGINERFYAFFDTNTFMPFFFSYMDKTMRVGPGDWVPRDSFTEDEFAIATCYDRKGNAVKPKEIRRKQ